MATRLFLVGCVHLDPEGPVRLAQWLDRLAPDYVTVEISPYAIAFRMHNAPRLLAQLQGYLEELAMEEASVRGLEPQLLLNDWLQDDRIVGIRRSIEMPYEYTQARAYHDRTGAVVEAVDLSQFSRQYLPLIEEELLTKRNLRALLQASFDSLREETRKEYAMARRTLQANATPLHQRAEDAERDARAAERIRFALGTGERRVVHICGVSHLLGYKGCLRERLAKWNPGLVMLDQSDDPVFCLDPAGSGLTGCAGEVEAG